MPNQKKWEEAETHKLDKTSKNISVQILRALQSEGWGNTNPSQNCAAETSRKDKWKLDTNEGTEKQQAPQTSESLEPRHKSTLSQQEWTPITQSFKHKATTNNQNKVPELEQHPQGASTEQ